MTDTISATPFNFAALADEAAFQATLSPSDPRHRDMADVSEDRRTITVFWGGAYDIDLDAVATPQDLLKWVAHIAKKTWPNATPYRVARFIELACWAKGWDLHGRIRHENEAPAAFVDRVAEREKMTPSLRYSVIRRDGYRCRACGASVADGAHLHVDHIVAVANGGKTDLRNLQALCTACNIGKGTQ